MYCSGDTPVTIEFPEDPGINTSMRLRYLQAVLGFFQNSRYIIVGRSSPASARVSALPDLKECMVNAVRSPALRACTFSVFPLMVVPVVGRWEIVGKRYLASCSSPVQSLLRCTSRML